MQLSSFQISENLKDCPSGHWQVGRPLPQGFPGRSPHCLLSMIDLIIMMVHVMIIYQNVFEVVITMIPVDTQGEKWMKVK